MTRGLVVFGHPFRGDSDATMRPDAGKVSVKHLTCVVLHLRYWSEQPVVGCQELQL